MPLKGTRSPPLPSLKVIGDCGNAHHSSILGCAASQVRQQLLLAYFIVVVKDTTETSILLHTSIRNAVHQEGVSSHKTCQTGNF